MVPIKETRSDRKKAENLLRGAEKTERFLASANQEAHPSNTLRELYEIIRQQLSALAAIEGKKASWEGAHKDLISYAKGRIIQENDADFIDELRAIRNRIAYDGYSIEKEYLEQRRVRIERIITELKEKTKNRLTAP